jgi:hypothetical protein
LTERARCRVVKCAIALRLDRPHDGPCDEAKPASPEPTAANALDRGRRK